MEWFLLLVGVVAYSQYLSSTIELPSDNEYLIFGQHQLTDPNQKKSVKDKKHNPNAVINIVIHSTEARLGNNMFQYASIYGIYQSMDAAQKHLCVHPQHGLPFLEDAVVGPLVDNCTHQELHNVKEIPDTKYATHYEVPFPGCEGSECSYALKGYYQSYKYFQGCCQDYIRSVFRFKPSIEEKATAVLRSVEPPIKIGIHVRRGDMTRRHFYLRDPPLSYYQNAMNHFADRYGSMQFLVASDDPDWCAQQPVFQNNDVLILRDNNNGPVDMAILSKCQHVILSRGSFGWWAAWLSGASAVYYKDVFVMEHPENKGKVKLEDHYPNHWIGMT